MSTEVIHYISISFVMLLITLLLIRRGIRSNFYLVFLLLIIVVGEILQLLNIRKTSDILVSVIDATVLLIGPTTLFYLRKKLNPDFMESAFDLFHVLPFLVGFLNTYLIQTGIVDNQWFVIFHHGIFKPLVGLVYFYFSFKGLRVAESRWLENYSRPEPELMVWLRYIIVSQIIVFLIYPVLVILDLSGAELSFNPGVVIYMLVLLFIFLITVVGIGLTKEFTIQMQRMQPVENASVDIVVKNNADNDSSKTNAIDNEKLKLLAIKIENFIATQKPFLNEKFSLQDLAVNLESHPRMVSEAIKTMGGKNFNDFVNGCRITEFERLVKAGKHKNLDMVSLAMECGFGSKSAFFRAFKNKLGITPMEFVKNIS